MKEGQYEYADHPCCTNPCDSRYSGPGVARFRGRFTKAGATRFTGTPQDLQRLDHLEYKRDRLLQLIEALT